MEELLITTIDYPRLTVEANGAAVVGVGTLSAALRYTLSLLGIR